MGETLTYVIELAVGLGCVVAAVPMARTPRSRWLAAVLAVAGLTAIVHAVSRLVA
jgi:peptidoglycan/LPS O-acetylase OafA/YrhL